MLTNVSWIFHKVGKSGDFLSLWQLLFIQEHIVCKVRYPHPQPYKNRELSCSLYLKVGIFSQPNYPRPPLMSSYWNNLLKNQPCHFDHHNHNGNIDTLPSPDNTWNTILAGVTQHEHWIIAFRLFLECLKNNKMRCLKYLTKYLHTTATINASTEITHQQNSSNFSSHFQKY